MYHLDSTKIHKILRYKRKKICTKSVRWKLYWWKNPRNPKSMERYSVVGRLHTVWVSLLSKLICRFSAILTKTQRFLCFVFVEINKCILKVLVKRERIQNSQMIFKRSKKLEDSPYLISSIIVKVWEKVWSQVGHKQIDQWDRKESRNGCTCLWPIEFWQTAKSTQLRRNSLFIKACWNYWTAGCKWSLIHTSHHMKN